MELLISTNFKMVQISIQIFSIQTKLQFKLKMSSPDPIEEEIAYKGEM